MTLDMNDPTVQMIAIEGVWRDLFPMSSWSAEERGSQLTEPIDLVKAIYIVDLEHVSLYWDDWQKYEKFVSSIRLANGRKTGFINRMERVITAHLERRENPGHFVRMMPPSPEMQEIVLAAQEMARNRAEEDRAPSSPEFLYCACAQDSGLSESLQQAGLQIEKLRAAVENPK